MLYMCVCGGEGGGGGELNEELVRAKKSYRFQGPKAATHTHHTGILFLFR